MKILWFSLSPCGSLKRNSSNKVISQGWMISLEDEIKKDKSIDLNVAYFSSIDESPFEYDGVHYYPMYDGYSKNPIKRVLSRRESVSIKDPKKLPQMLEVIKNVNPDLIHIHGTEESFGLILDYVKDIPIAISIQGLIAPFKEKYFCGMPFAQANRYESIKDKLTFVSIKDHFNDFSQRAERENHYLSKANYVFGRTFWDRDISLALNPQREYYVVNEMMRKPFYNKIWEKKHFSEKLQLVSTISGGIYKGYETVLRTANLLKNYSGIDFEWHVVGYDNNSKWVHIAERLTALTTRDCNVVLHGRIEANGLSEMLVNSDIYCHVSHIENSPNSVCEAMLIGMPIIASFAGGTSSILENEKEGLLYQDGDPYILAGEIIRLFQNFNEAKSFGKAARERAYTRHNNDNVARELLEAYSNILSEYNNRDTK